MSLLNCGKHFFLLQSEPEIPVTIAMSSGLLFKQEQQGCGPAFKFVEVIYYEGKNTYTKLHVVVMWKMRIYHIKHHRNLNTNTARTQLLNIHSDLISLPCPALRL